MIDLETAGSSAEVGGITEIGAVKYRGGEEIDRFSTLVNPGCAIPSFIVMLTGITDGMVEIAPNIADVLDQLLEFIGDSVIVAHNAGFDMGFINAALVNSGRGRLPNKVVDTVTLARRLVRNEVRDCKLSTLAAGLGLRHQPNHRAMGDVLATGDLLHLLIERASGFGVFDLDDLVALPKISSHPQWKKLKMTEDLPRSPGVYLFVDTKGVVLYVGKATNLRQRVRSYFSTNESRAKVGSLLNLTHGIHYIESPDPLTAEVLELRIVGRLRPHYNQAGTHSERYCYVRLTTDEEWPRLMISKAPSSKGISVGPMSTRSMARDVIDAIESVFPLRRCTARMGRNYKPPPDAQVCSAAQLGLAQCPCSGTADASTYAELVQVVGDTLLGESIVVFDLLNAKMQIRSEAQRFEDAALVRDRMQKLETVLRRQRQANELCDAGNFTVAVGDVVYEIECGVLAGTRMADQLFTPLSSTHMNVQRLVAMPRFHADIDALISPPESARTADGSLLSNVIDEVMCIARFVEVSGFQKPRGIVAGSA